MKATLTIVRGVGTLPKAMMAFSDPLAQDVQKQVFDNVARWWDEEGRIMVMSNVESVAFVDVDTTTGEVKIIK